MWEKRRTGEFRHHVDRKRRQLPLVDHEGRICTHNEEHFLLDDRFPRKDDRHIVLRAHCFTTEDGTIGGSGKIDPKEMIIGDINYRQLAFENPRCELCEGGDMIHPKHRFQSSTYKPSIWRYWFVRLRAMIKA